MLEQLLDKINTLIGYMEDFTGLTIGSSSGINNVKMIALILIFSALFIFISLILIIILKNIFSFFSRNNKPINSTPTPSDEYYDDALFSEDEQLELEREMQKELELALAQRAELENRREQEQAEMQKQKNIRQKEKEKKQQEEDEESFLHRAEKQRQKLSIGLDWQKQTSPVSANSNVTIDKTMLSYQQTANSLHELNGLLIDMISRGIDDLKIAQTINYKTQGRENEGEILKMIDSVRYLIRLFQDGTFTQLSTSKQLPDLRQALYHFANNDPSLVLVLLENAMDKMVDKASLAGDDKKQKIFSEVSMHACCFGSLAENSDIMLATSVYEMAIELNPNNPTAWSRLGDVYRKADADSKAIWAYQNAYSYADEELNGADLANASNHLSEYLYTQGNSLQAAKMHNTAKQYYDSLGINKYFSKQEIEAINIIETNQSQNLPEIIENLLQNSPIR